METRCSEFGGDVLLELHRGLLDRERRNAVEEHLSICEVCRRRAHHIGKTLGALSELASEHIPSSKPLKAALDGVREEDTDKPVRRGAAGHLSTPRAEGGRAGSGRFRSAVLRYAALPLSAAAVLILAVLFGFERDIGRVLEVEGELLVDGTRSEAGAGLRGGALLTTDGHSSAVVELADSSKIELNSSSLVRIRGPRRIFLQRGEIAASIAPAEGRPFVAQAAGATAEVLGTKFLLGSKDDEVLLAVAEGKVRFSTSSGTVTVSGGEESRVREGGEPSMPRKASIALLFSWSTIAAGALGASPSDWPMAGHDPQRTGCSPNYVVGPFEYDWVKYYDEKVIFAQLVTWGDRGFFPTLHGSVFCIDLSTGGVVWKTKTGAPMMGSAATDGRSVYAVGTDGTLTALDAADGKERWRFRGGEGSVAHVLLVNGAVVYTDMGGSCYAVDAGSGGRLWGFDAGAMILHSPASDGKRVFFGTEAAKAFALDLKTGRKLWEKQLFGASFKEGWPVVSAPSKTVMFTLMPLQRWGAEPWGKVKLNGLPINKIPQPKSAAEHRAMQDLIVEAIKTSPGGQVHWFLDTETGKERYVAPLLYNKGRWACMSPACVDPQGNFVIGFGYPPSRPQQRNPQYRCYHVGTFDARMGRLIPPYHTIGESGWDEHYSLTLAGRTVFRNHWSVVAVQDMDGKGYRTIFTPGHVSYGTRPEGPYPGSMGWKFQNGNNGLSVGGNGNVFAVYSSYVCRVTGQLKENKR